MYTKSEQKGCTYGQTFQNWGRKLVTTKIGDSIRDHLIIEEMIFNNNFDELSDRVYCHRIKIMGVTELRYVFDNRRNALTWSEF